MPQESSLDVAARTTDAASGLPGILTIVGLVLTIIAFLIAVFQVFQARSQSRELKGHEVALGTIAAALSTRYLGPFPEFLPAVVDMINRAKNDLLVVNVNPTPAYFSAPLQWVEYRHAVDAKIHSNVAVTLITANEAHRLRRMRDQFDIDAAEWPEWCARNKDLLHNFLLQQYPAEANAPVTVERFRDMLVDTQGRLTADLFGRATRLYVDSAMTLHVWVVDAREAVFTIETTVENGLSHGLYTSDPKFVAALYAMAELYRTNGDS